jgi:hypothetical protein
MVRAMDQIDDLLRRSCTPGGSGFVEFAQMLELLEAGGARGLNLFTVDVCTKGQTRPLGHLMYRFDEDEMSTIPAAEKVGLALGFYRENATDPELTSAWFEVFFEGLT